MRLFGKAADIGTAVRATFAFFILASDIASVASAAAQNYPNKPIRIIVPLAAGGQADVVARILTAKLTETFKQALVVDNRSGGGGTVGTVGTETTVRAAAIITRIHAEVLKAIDSSEVKARLAMDGAEIVASTPSELASFINADIRKWVEVVQRSGKKF